MLQRRLKQTKKSRLLLKKKIIKIEQASKYSYLYKLKNYGRICPVDVKEEESPRKQFIQDMFCFRKINQIVRNENFLCLKLKEINIQRTSVETHLNRFEDSNMQIFKNFGKFLIIFDQKMKKKCSTYSRTLLPEGQDFFKKELQQTLSINKNKKFVCFYYGPSANLLDFNQILISNEMLTALGHDSQDICDDFLKYRHIYFQIFETSMFDSLISILGQNCEQIIANLQQIQERRGLESEESLKLKKSLQFKFEDQIKSNQVLTVINLQGTCYGPLARAWRPLPFQTFSESLASFTFSDLQ